MEVNAQILGKIFDIQGFSVHDGPGARSLIFMKGCSLNCFWCSNPEGISQFDLPLYYGSKCIVCGNCVESCLHDAITLQGDKIIIDRVKCEACKDHSCVETCFTDALRMSGRSISVDELFAIIQRDRQYWGPDGGITLSGGEPLLQLDFAHAILKKCHEAYIHTAIETCANVPWHHFERVIDHLDWIFFDIKHSNIEQHNSGTGGGNENIITNIQKLNEYFTGDLVFRLPFIPTFNDSEENLRDMAALIAGTKWKIVNILPLHHLGRDKYLHLDKPYKAKDFPVPTQEELKTAVTIFEELGVKCYIGNELPF
jgi:glycyl-radical enzyme activating protein